MNTLENTSLIAWTGEPQKLISELSLNFQVDAQPSEGPE